MEATTSPIGAASDATDGARNRPYDLRPRRGAAGKTAPGAGVEVLLGTAGRAGAQPQTMFKGVDVKPAESDEEYSDAVEVDTELESSGLDRYEIRSIASVTDPVEAESPQREGDMKRGSMGGPEGTARRLPAPPPRTSRDGGGADGQGHRHHSPPGLEEMTWAEFDAYRRIHEQFRKRALEGRGSHSPRPDEPFNRRDLPSAGREARLDDGDRRGPRTSRVFGDDSTAPRRGPGARTAAGELSDKSKK